MPAYDTAALVAQVQRRALVPTSQAAFPTADILAVASEELSSWLVPLLLSVREEYFVAEETVQLLDGVEAYSIPPRAIGGKLRDVLYEREDGGARANLVRVEPELAPETRTLTGAPLGFSLRAHSVVLYPPPSAVERGKLRLSYYRRPGSLVLPEAAGRVLSYNPDTNEVTLQGPPPASFVPGVQLDFIQALPGFESLAIDMTVAAVTGNVLTLAGDLPLELPFPLDGPTPLLPPGLLQGDWVCLAGESAVPQVPPELHPVLALRTAAVLLEAAGDMEAADVARKELADKQARALTVVAPRVDGEPRKVPNGMAKWRGPRGRVFL